MPQRIVSCVAVVVALVSSLCSAPALVRAEEAPAIPAPWSSPATAPAHPSPSTPAKEEPLKVTGRYRLSLGFTRDEVILNKGHGDLNERNFRILSGNLHENTFDPAVYSYLGFDVDTVRRHGWMGHANITIDPWSFIGTTEKFTIHGEGGDSATLELKWWGGNNRVLNETFFTQENGDGFATPEIEVDNGHTVQTRLTSTFSNIFTIPEREIDYRFHPLREFWLDYAQGDLEFRFFPIAYEDQAITSDDPLRLSNHRSYWEQSPWMDEWRPGIFHPGATPDDFTRGNWNDDLIFNTRDSALRYLSSLRGAKWQWQPSGRLSWQGGVASPKTLWEEYETFNRFVGMSRLHYTVADFLQVGATYTSRWGYHDRALDAYNHVYSVDTTVEPTEDLTFKAQLATSHSSQDRTTDFTSALRGQAWHLELGMGSSDLSTALTWEDKKLWHTGAPEQFRLRLWYTHMDEAFDPGLANYRETRDDTHWGRHLAFYKPLTIYRGELTPIGGAAPMPLQDILPFRIGEGIDTGRDVVHAQLLSKLFDERVMSLYDIRNVHKTDGQYEETVARTEQAWHITPRLTSKFLFLYHDKRNHQGIDPFVFNPDLNVFLDNANLAVQDGTPSAMTFALGAGYYVLTDLLGWFSWERTQDVPFGGSDNYPRGLFNDANFTTFRVGDQVIRRQTVFLYNNFIFPQPPYPWFDIYRAGVHWKVSDALETNVTWTRNEFEYAGQIDGNMNHIGFEASFHPVDRFALLGKYTLSRSVSLPRIAATSGASIENQRHHNVYFQGLYRVTDDSELSVEFGVGGFVAPSTVFSVNPVEQYFPVLDTQPIVRIAYTGRF